MRPPARVEVATVVPAFPFGVAGSERVVELRERALSRSADGSVAEGGVSKRVGRSRFQRSVRMLTAHPYRDSYSDETSETHPLRRGHREIPFISG